MRVRPVLLFTSLTTTLDHLPLDTKNKAKPIRTKVLPMGLYGCETARISDTALRTLRSRIAKALSHGNVPGSADFIYNSNSHGTDTDPNTDICIKRVVDIHRASALSENWELLIRQNLAD